MSSAIVAIPNPVPPAAQSPVALPLYAPAKSKCTQPAPSFSTNLDKNPAALLAPPAPPPGFGRLFAVSANSDGHFS